jgi:hypothetical protein
MILAVHSGANGQNPTRVGTTAANFLEIGYGAAGAAMGDAYVSTVRDASAMYWNPAGLALMNSSEAIFTAQPWVADISASFAGVALKLGDIGTLGLSFVNVDYGDMEVTTLAMQEGTGESFSPHDVALGISYARQLVTWFAFGATAKFVNSNIWHSDATAFAFDLGVLVNTEFFSPTDDRNNGLCIGMSISNYGTQLKYDGLDLLNPIDIEPGEQGNYADVRGQFQVQSWQLPLLFRLGVSVTPLSLEHHRVVLAVDALHPNNNSESMNVGGEYTFSIPDVADVNLRGGYKGIFMENSQYGMTMGIGLQSRFIAGYAVRFDYAFRDVGMLGNTHCYGISVTF